MPNEKVCQFVSFGRLFRGYGLPVTGYGLCQVVAVMLEAAGVGTPIAVHFDKELEEDLFLEELLYVFAGLRTYPFKRRTGFADDDAFLGFSFAVYHCRNLDEISFGRWSMVVGR